jgi:hypothetical protein
MSGYVKGQPAPKILWKEFFEIGQVCTVCTHPGVAEIEAALANGQGKRRIAIDKGLSEASLRRHADNCIPKSLAVARSVNQMIRSDKFAGHLLQIYEKAQWIGAKAEKLGDEERSASAYRVAMSGVREEIRISEFYVNALATVTTSGDERVDLMRTILLDETCDECREAVGRRFLAESRDATNGNNKAWPFARGGPRGR